MGRFIVTSNISNMIHAFEARAKTLDSKADKHLKRMSEDLLAQAQYYSGFSFYNKYESRRFDYPYSKRHGSGGGALPLPPYFISNESGRFYAGWKIMGVSTARTKGYSVYNDAGTTTGQSYSELFDPRKPRGWSIGRPIMRQSLAMTATKRESIMRRFGQDVGSLKDVYKNSAPKVYSGQTIGYGR